MSLELEPGHMFQFDRHWQSFLYTATISLGATIITEPIAKPALLQCLSKSEPALTSYMSEE